MEEITEQGIVDDRFYRNLLSEIDLIPDVTGIAIGRYPEDTLRSYED